MSSNVQLDVQASSSTPSCQPIFDEALKEYKKKTGKDLATHPLAEEIKGCDSPQAILAVLQGKANELSQSQSSNERLTKCLKPTVNVINALSATLGEGVGTVFPPTKIIFSGISILLVAARDTAASRDVLIELFDKIKDFFLRLKIYTEVPATAELTTVMGKIMAEVLYMLAIATKEMKQGRTKTFLKKLAGQSDIENALLKLDKLEQGELRAVSAQVFKATSDIKGGMNRIEVIAQQIGDDVSAHDWKRRQWLSPPDPSINHNILRIAQHESTTVWFFKEDIFSEWVSSGSLLWVHGKVGSGKSILCSAIIQHFITPRDAGSASVAYFYFDFKDVNKKYRRNLLSSLLTQLSSRSERCANILSRVYSTHHDGQEQPSEHTLVQCLKDMLMAPPPIQLPTYIILDALDECPNTSGIPTPREHVLALVEELVDLHLPNLRICVTSRPEVDIYTALEPLTSHHLSLHDQPGQKKDIDDYITAVVQSDTKMKRWREDDRKLVIDTLSEKADGMFRWAFCQLEVLRHCLAPSLRDQLNELPRSLDETYERVLKEIQSTNQGRHACRLLHCLAVAIRPLQAEDLAEVLAFDPNWAEEGVPTFHPEWRWENQEQAVLSACSSLIAIVDVDSDYSRVIQFAHFSVKEYLTSDRLAAASGDISQYRILPDPAHLTLAQACLGVLLRSNNCIDEGGDVNSDEEDVRDFPPSPRYKPLFEYAVHNWVSHAQVGNVSSRLKYAMETLFDPNKPYFLEWIRVSIIDGFPFWNQYYNSEPNPLYCAALCGFYELVQHLTIKYPEQINHRGGRYGTPLVAALSGKHVRIANFLFEHDAQIHVRGDPPLFRAMKLIRDARIDAMRFLLKHGARVDAADEFLQTPLHMAASLGRLEVARILLDHGADPNLRNDRNEVPLHLLSGMPHPRFELGVEFEVKGDRSMLAQLILKHCVDVDAQDCLGQTPLHAASFHGQLEISQLLLDHGANPHVTDKDGRTPLHKLLDGAHQRFNPQSPEPPQNFHGIAQLLMERGVDVNATDSFHKLTPLHLVSQELTAQLLLDHGAKIDAKDDRGQTPLHLVSRATQLVHDEPYSADVAQLLLELGADVNVRDENQETPLHFACEYGNFDTMLLLVNHGAEINAQNTLGQTPLHQISGHIGWFHVDFHDGCFAQLLLQRGADVNARNKGEETPLHLAVCRSKLQTPMQTPQVLLEHGAEADARDTNGRTPLHHLALLAFSGDEERPMERLLLKSGASVDARDKAQETPLHLASTVLNVGTAKVLLEHGANVKAENDRGLTPLHMISLSGSSPRPINNGPIFVHLLLEQSADVNARGMDQVTPLHLASSQQDFGIARVLLKNGADVNAVSINGWNALHFLLLPRLVEVKIAKLLLSWGVDVNAQDELGETPLHSASYFGHVDVAEAFLDHGARANVENTCGNTPLHNALQGHCDYHIFWQIFGDHPPPSFQKEYPGRFIRLIQQLLERGADVNAQNKGHETPLHLASRFRLLEVVRILLKHGADVDVKNSEGKSPLQLATGRKRKAMRRLLLAHSSGQA